MTNPITPDSVVLKPCPFCGDEAGPEIDGDEFATINATYTIFCNGCHASAATEHTYAEALRRWNTRAAISAMPPEGWKLVPVSADRAMLEAARDWSSRIYGKPIGNLAASGCYTAMLAASPSQDQTS